MSRVAGGRAPRAIERWAKAPSPLKGPFVGFLLSVSGLISLFFGVFWVVVGGRLVGISDLVGLLEMIHV